MAKYVIEEEQDYFLKGGTIFYAYELYFFGIIKNCLTETLAYSAEECESLLRDFVKNAKEIGKRKLYKKYLKIK